MGQENFHASAKYNDMKGTAAADDHDHRDMAEYLKQQKLIADDEILVGIKMWSGEVTDQVQNDPVYVYAYVTKFAGYENVKEAVESGNPLDVRQIDLKMSVNEFFGLFKRFEVTLSSHGVIDGVDINIV